MVSWIVGDESNDALESEVRALLAEGKKLHAIARYHQVTGKSLSEASDAVTNIQHGRAPDAPQPPAWKRSAPLSDERRKQLESKLPERWTLGRVREIEPRAELLDPSEHRVRMVETVDQYHELGPEVILRFNGNCLIREPGDPEWAMGQIAPDGTITCWGYYGDDLADAIRAL
jgi:transposase